MNRARWKDESFEGYRKAEKIEDERIKQHLMGKYAHTSKVFTAEGTPMPGLTREGHFDTRLALITKRAVRSSKKLANG